LFHNTSVYNMTYNDNTAFREEGSWMTLCEQTQPVMTHDMMLWWTDEINKATKLSK
jgi:hypothetical protein